MNDLDSAQYRGQGQEEALAWLLGAHVATDASFSLLEIGVWTGLTAVRLLEQFPTLEYWGVDPFLAFECERDETTMQAVRDLARERLTEHPRAHLLEVTSEQAGRQLLRHFDCIFIDGCHAYEACLADLALWWPRTRRVMCGHDYYGRSVSDAVADFCAARGLRASEVPGLNTWYLLAGPKEAL
jgi:hypothetical protein